MTTPDASALRVHASGRELITQIAETLGVPKAVFFEGGETADPGTQILNETVELIKLFSQIEDLFTQIEDQETRRRCVADVKAVSEKLASSVAHDDGNAA